MINQPTSLILLTFTFRFRQCDQRGLGRKAFRRSPSWMEIHFGQVPWGISLYVPSYLHVLTFYRSILNELSLLVQVTVVIPSSKSDCIAPFPRWSMSNLSPAGSKAIPNSVSVSRLSYATTVYVFSVLILRRNWLLAGLWYAIRCIRNRWVILR